MKIEQRVYNTQTQRQEQRLVLSPQMRFSLDVLRLPLDAVRDLIEEQLLENPLLDTEEMAEGEFFAEMPLKDEYAALAEEKYAQLWDEDFSAPRVRQQSGEWTGEIYDPGSLRMGQSFTSMLLEQLVTLRLDKTTNRLCRYLIDCLDERGYLCFPLEELAAERGVSVAKLESALDVVQSLEPPGTGARNLQECLMLQLIEYDHIDRCAARIINEELETLARKDWKALAKKLDCDKETTIEAIKTIQSLNPIPAQGYYTEEKTHYIIPDAIIVEENGSFQIIMNRRALPKLTVNTFYTNSFGDYGGEEVKDYLKERNASAKTTIQAVEERLGTLERILLEIVAWQPTFFHEGKGLQPMYLKDVAEALGMHVSTVSRGVQNKYISCVAGTIPLKQLFTTGIAAENGGSVSNTVVQKMIAKCIAEEDKGKPLSDEKLRLALEDMGIHLARRTVMKYREILGIPKSSERKKGYSL